MTWIITIVLAIVCFAVAVATGMPFGVAVIVTLVALFVIAKVVDLFNVPKKEGQEQREWTRTSNGQKFSGWYHNHGDKTVTIAVERNRKQEFPKTDADVSHTDIFIYVDLDRSKMSKEDLDYVVELEKAGKAWKVNK